MISKHYSNIEEAINDVIIEVRVRGKETKAGKWQGTDNFKDQSMLVLRNYMFNIPCPLSIEYLKTQSGADSTWAEEHFQERISGIPSNPGESYKRWPYNTFKPENDPYMKGEVFTHTYQERFWAGIRHDEIPRIKGIRYSYGDLNDVIIQLRNNPLTRQAYLPIFFPEDTGALHKGRVPCTLGYYFWVEDSKLHCNYLIRSCDLFRHFRNDIYLTCRLMQYISDELGIEPGELNFMAFNIHLFKNDGYAFNQREKRLRNERI